MHVYTHTHRLAKYYMRGPAAVRLFQNAGVHGVSKTVRAKEGYAILRCPCARCTMRAHTYEMRPVGATRR